MFEPWVYWLAAAVITVVAVEGWVRRRRGTWKVPPVYRNSALPAFMRNGWLFIGPLAALFSPVLLLTLPFVLWPSIGAGLPRNITLALVLVGFGYAAALGGLLFVLSSRPPVRMIPSWLDELDRRVGFVRPRFDWYDALTFLFGVLSVILGVGLVLGGAILTLIPGLFGW